MTQNSQSEFLLKLFFTSSVDYSLLNIITNPSLPLGKDIQILPTKTLEEPKKN